MVTYLHKLVCYKIEIGYLKQHCPPASSGMIWNGFALSGGRFRLKFSEERVHLSDAHLQSLPGQGRLGPNRSCHCLQSLTSLVMHTVPLKLSPPPWELVTAHHTWKTIRHRKFWDWPQHVSALLFCPISGWLQRRWGWCSVDAPASPTSFSELPIYFLWQFAQIVKIPCNYSYIWKPNMIYFWQAQSSLG